MGDGGYNPELVPRLCHIVRWSDFNGYGFNLHAEKGKAGQFIGKVDEGSPAEAAGLRPGDRIVEVNGTNIGNENHQQVVGRVKQGGDETRLLVVDADTDLHYKENKKVVRGDLPEVKFLTAARDGEEIQNEVPQMEDTFQAAAVIQDTNGTEPEAEPEPELQQSFAAAVQQQDEDNSEYTPRLCQLCKWPDFDGFGFNLHAEKDKPGQYIGLVDPDSPAELGGLKEGDRIVEVNGENCEAQSHTVVIQRIKNGGEKTSMLVVDKATDDYFKRKGMTVCSSMTSVVIISTPPRLTGSMEASEAILAAVPGGEEEEDEKKEEEEEKKEEEEEVVVASQEEEENVGVVEDSNPYEEVQVTTTSTTSTTVVSFAPPNDEQEHLEKTSLKEEEATAVEEEEEAKAENSEGSGKDDEEKAETNAEDSPATNGQEEETVPEIQDVAAVGAEGKTEVSEPVPEPQEVKVEHKEDSNTEAEKDQESGSAPNGINGGSAGDAAIISQTSSEPEPAVITSTTTTTSYSAPTPDAGDPILHLSAAEMKERLKSRKKQDPRHNKASFESKYKMFEKM